METKPWAVVTGASGGLGRALAIDLARRHYNVALAARGEEGLQVTADRIRAEGAEASTQALNVADWASVHQWADAELRRHGQAPAVVIANAGQFAAGRLDALDAEVIRGVLDTAVFGTAWTVKAFLPALLNAKRGHIMAVSSVAAAPGHEPVPGTTTTIYFTAKRAVADFCRSLRREVHGTGIRVTTVFPAGMANLTDLDADPATIQAHYPDQPVLSLAHVSSALLDQLDGTHPVVEELVLWPNAPS